MCHHTTFPSHTFTSVPGAKSVTPPDRFVRSQPLGCQIQPKCPVRQWSRRAPEGIKSNAACKNFRSLQLSSRLHPLRMYMDWRHLRDGQPNTFPSDLGSLAVRAMKTVQIACGWFYHSILTVMTVLSINWLRILEDKKHLFLQGTS